MRRVEFDFDELTENLLVKTGRPIERCFTGSIDILGMSRNINLEDPGKPLRKHAAGVTSFYRKPVDNFRIEFGIADRLL